MKPLLTKRLSSIALGMKENVGELKVGVQDATTEIQEVHAEQSKDILDRAIEDKRMHRITGLSYRVYSLAY
jgi:hypothetical protein